MSSKNEKENLPVFTEQIMYRCPSCRTVQPEKTYWDTYDLERDSIICDKCSIELALGKDGKGARMAETVVLHRCPECGSLTNEKFMPKTADGHIYCPACTCEGISQSLGRILG